VPLRIELGPKDIEKNQVVIARRDTSEKSPASQTDLAATVLGLLNTVQKAMFDRAVEFRDRNSYQVDDYGKFNDMLDSGGFLWSHWCGSDACEERVKTETKATIRCIPLQREKENGKCLVCGGQSDGRVIFARSY
jgi:prolyl-tRNA synthetase